MMLARLGIDKTKSWADRVEEEEELAQLTKTLEDTESELGSGEESGEESDLEVTPHTGPPPPSRPPQDPTLTPHGSGPHPHTPRNPTLTHGAGVSAHVNCKL